MNIFFSSAICDAITFTLRGYMHSLAVITFRPLYGFHTMRCIDYIHASRVHAQPCCDYIPYLVRISYNASH